MPQLINRRGVAEDSFVLLRDARSFGELPDGTPVIVPLALWRERRGALIARGEVGVWLGPADDPATLAPDLAHLRVIAIDFPQFTDGRGYSHARLLRERYRYTGELRAVGDVGRDQLYYLSQCGFDSFLLPDHRNADEALASFNDFTDGYQSTVSRTPWFRRRPATAANESVAFPCA